MLAGSVAAGFGLGALGLALILPPPDAAPLPPLPEAAAQAVVPAQTSRVWPAVFGSPPPAAPPVAEIPVEPEDEGPLEAGADDDYLPYTDHDYQLRGMVAHTGGPDEGSGWALIESSVGIEVVRVGSELSGGETIVEITPHGVILQGYGAAFLLSFLDDPDYGDSDFDDYADDEGGTGGDVPARYDRAASGRDPDDDTDPPAWPRSP